MAGTANIYQFACGSVAYFAPDAPDFQEAGELKGDALDKALRVLDAGERPETIQGLSGFRLFVADALLNIPYWIK